MRSGRMELLCAETVTLVFGLYLSSSSSVAAAAVTTAAATATAAVTTTTAAAANFYCGAGRD